jgi:hypothetical protein
MITIHKYQFGLSNEFEVKMPSSAIILSVQEQHNKWTMWARVDTELPAVNRKFVAYWTGEELPKGVASLNYIATVQDYYVWHIFEQVNQLNPAKGAVINTMNNFDPNAATQQAEGQPATNDAVQATEQEAQEKAMESAEEGTTEG